MDNFEIYTFVTYSIADTKVTQTSYSETYLVTNDHYEATANMDIITYTKDTALKFSATKGNPYLHQTDANFQDGCNRNIKMSMLAADITLMTTCGLRLNDLGFVSYN